MSAVEIIVIVEDTKAVEERKIVSKIEQLKELEELIEEAKEEVEKLKAELKEEMQKRNTEELAVGRYIMRWTEVLSNRFDSTRFKKMFPSMYKDFTKEVSSRRFSISG